LYRLLPTKSYTSWKEADCCPRDTGEPNVTNRGVELGVSVKVDNNWTIDFAGTKSEFYYANNPMGIMNSENGVINNVEETVYLKNYHV